MIEKMDVAALYEASGRQLDEIKQAARRAALEEAAKAAWPHKDERVLTDYDKGRMDARRDVLALLQ